MGRWLVRGQADRGQRAEGEGNETPGDRQTNTAGDVLRR